MKIRAALLEVVAFIALAGGSMFLAGFIGHVIAPTEYVDDHFIGTTPHLLAGLVPWIAGITILCTLCHKNSQVPTHGLAGIGVALFLALPATIHSRDFTGIGSWIAMMLSAYAVVWIIERTTKKTEPRH